MDVAGYREKRSAALKRFSVQIAEEVTSSGQEKALEAMSPADRKSVHDAINEMAGVVTRSEGEDPNRYIVIAPRTDVPSVPRTDDQGDSPVVSESLELVLAEARQLGFLGPGPLAQQLRHARGVRDGGQTAL